MDQLEGPRNHQSWNSQSHAGWTGNDQSWLFSKFALKEVCNQAKDDEEQAEDDKEAKARSEKIMEDGKHVSFSNRKHSRNAATVRIL